MVVGNNINFVSSYWINIGIVCLRYWPYNMIRIAKTVYVVISSIKFITII